MKRSLKAVLTLIMAVAMLLSMVPSAAFAGADKTAYIMYADSAWTYQYWSDPVDTGVQATDVTITGPGQYTVGLDFTGTADGAAAGLAFTAIGIKNGEKDFPGYSIEINSIKINGEDIEFTKGYTSSDDGIETRMNIYNSWVTGLKDDDATLRSYDGDLSDVNWMIVNPDDFASVETMTVDFTLYDADGNDGSAAVEDTTDDAATTTDATTEETTTDAPKTGVVSLGIVYGLGAIATGAVALKRKQK